VAWFGAMQAQEYEPAKWAIGLRMPDGTTSAKVQRACDEGRILSTHVMRPTWHFVAAADIRWLLQSRSWMGIGLKAPGCFCCLTNLGGAFAPAFRF